MIFYLHGFNSIGDPNNLKIKLLRTICDDVHIVTYDSFRPAHEIFNGLVDQAIKLKRDDLVFAGISLGGFFAAHLANHFGAKGVLINPLHKPDFQLAQLGLDKEFENFDTKEVNRLTYHTIISYKELQCISRMEFANALQLIIAKDDEILDVEETKLFYNEHKIFEIERGGHRCANFHEALPTLNEYLLT
jgi:predicted esterase YcpF (UPF0227 family)